MPPETPDVCAVCGHALPGESVGGFCPACLARMAFGRSRLVPQQVSAESLAAALPQPLGDYQLIQWIGQGPSGSVFRATHRPSGDTVAVRLLERGPLATGEFAQRWLAEGSRLPSGMTGVARPRTCGVHGSLRYLVTDWVDGVPWERQQQPLPPATAREWLLAAARQLAPLHAAGLVHANLKPGNIVRTPAGEVILLDPGFGRNPAPDSEQTLHGQVFSDPAYAAPEQLHGLPQNLGPAVDVYSLGAVWFRLVTGRPPFAGTSFAAVAREASKSRGPVWADGDHIPAACRDGIERLMHRVPGHRPGSVAAVMALLADG